MHSFNLRRDTTAKRRELRVQYLIEAYRRLEDNTGRIEQTPDAYRAFESAVSDIQLLGTNKQIDALLTFLSQFKDNVDGDINPLLELIRCDLREELNLEPNLRQIHQFRFNFNKLTHKS